MKLRHVLLVLSIAVLLAACNFTLAEDVTPPPDYVPPTPAPTMGPLFPANTPNIMNGAAIYIEKCEPCHGSTGLGDGPKGKELSVKVSPIGLASFAQEALPSTWFMTVTQGNLERFMPPFASLNDQERWDVVSYALTLHSDIDQIAQGKSLVDSSCTDCAKTFSNLEMMSALSENDLIQIMKKGKGDISAFGKNFTEDESLAAAAYLRSLTYAAPHAAVAAVAASETPVSAETGTPSAETTPVNGTQAAVTPEASVQAAVTVEAAPVAGFGKVSGSLDNQTGKPLPSDMKVTLRVMEHGTDLNAGPQEIKTFEGSINPDGTYVFENIEIPENRIFIADADVNGSVYTSEFAVVKAGDVAVVIPPIAIFEGTTDYSTLQITSMQIYFDFAIEGSAQMFSVYTIANITDKTVTVKMTDAKNIPFIAFAEGSEALGFETTQDTATFVQTGDGFAMPPSTTPYGLIAFASIPKTDKIEISQGALLPIDLINIFLPEGMEAKGSTLKDEGIQLQNGTNFHVYSSLGLKKDESIKFTVTGKPSSVAVNPNILQNKALLIGVGALGLVLILAGVWLFMRGPKKVKEVDQDENEFEDPESLMDAIIALDDLHRAGKLSDEAYQKRRDELKSVLKRKG